MLSVIETTASASIVVAHPVTEPFQIPVSPAAAAGVAAVVVFGVALIWPQRRGSIEDGPGVGPEEEAGPRRGSSGAPPGRPVGSWEGDLSPLQWVTRVAAILLLVIAIAAGRLGVDDELDNLAPALIVGVAWPLLILCSCFGPIWRWLDPWDGATRPFDGGAPATSVHDVRFAAVLVLPWVWYLSAFADPLDPRSVGAALGFYTILTLAGVLASGRVRWLSSAEPLGIMLSWLSLLPRGRLVDWAPPRGAEALLGSIAGGVLFGAVRRSELWGELNSVPDAPLFATLGVIVSCLVVVGLLYGIRWAAAFPETRPLVARGIVPLVAGIILAVALDRNRLFTSLQLLPGLLGDPFGAGWDLFGDPTESLDPAPLGDAGLLWAQLGILLAGSIAGTMMLAGASRQARTPVAALLSVLVALAVIAVATH